MSDKELMERFAKQMCEKDNEIAGLRVQLAEAYTKNSRSLYAWLKEKASAETAESRAAKLTKQNDELREMLGNSEAKFPTPTPVEKTAPKPCHLLPGDCEKDGCPQHDHRKPTPSGEVEP